MNTVGPVVDAMYTLLASISKPVYKVDVPEQEAGNYVIIRPESGSGINNKRSLNDTVIIITDVVTRFDNNINGAVTEALDVEVFDKIMPLPQSNVLSASGLQVLNVNRESFNYLQERDGVNVYNRKISRYSIRIHQT